MNKIRNDSIQLQVVSRNVSEAPSDAWIENITIEASETCMMIVQ